MSNELDRLLAEGPRVAPEPPMVADDGKVAHIAPPVTTPAVTTPAVTKQNTTSVPSPSIPARAGSRSRGGLARRLLPLLVVSVVAARGFSSGATGAVVFALVWVAVLSLILIRKARKL